MISPDALRLLNLGPTAWARTQSAYRATAELFPAGSHGAVIFSQPLHPYLTHGIQQDAAEAFDLAACERQGLPVVQRPFPGGAEYCDVNQLLFQWVLPTGDDISRLPVFHIRSDGAGSSHARRATRKYDHAVGRSASSALA